MKQGDASKVLFLEKTCVVINVSMCGIEVKHCWSLAIAHHVHGDMSTCFYSRP